MSSLLVEPELEKHHTTDRQCTVQVHEAVRLNVR